MPPVLRPLGPEDAMPPQPAPRSRHCAISESTTKPCPKGAGHGASCARLCRHATRTICRLQFPASPRCEDVPEVYLGATKEPTGPIGRRSNRWDRLFVSYPQGSDNPVITPTTFNAALDYCHIPSNGYGAATTFKQAAVRQPARRFDHQVTPNPHGDA